MKCARGSAHMHRCKRMQCHSNCNYIPKSLLVFILTVSSGTEKFAKLIFSSHLMDSPAECLLQLKDSRLRVCSRLPCAHLCWRYFLGSWLISLECDWVFVLTFSSSLEEGSPHTLIAHLFSYCFHPSRNKVIIGIRLCKRILDLSKLRSKRRNPPC